MKHFLYIAASIILFQACSLLKQPEKAPETKAIPEAALIEAIEHAISEIVKNAAISDFLLENNARPTIIATTINNHSNAKLNTEIIYETIEMNLIQTGQVRVLKSDEEQRKVKPEKITKAISIDFALGTIISENDNQTYSLKLSLWESESSKPIVTVESSIE